MNKEFSCSLRSALLIKALFLSLSSCAWGKDYFDPALLSISGGQGQIASLDQFSEAGTTPQGKYLVEVYINQIDKKEHMVTFSPGKNNKIRPELTPAFLKTLGVNIASVPALKIVPENEPLDDIRKYIPDSQVKFNFSKLRLNISVPQIAMLTTVQGYVDPEYWDEGIPAAVLNYNINGSVNRYKGGSFTGESKQTNLFANWYGGLNWRAWRLRGNATWSYNDHASAGDFNSRYQKVDLNSVYLQRDIIALKSNLLMGENSTGGDVFDSFPFRGVQLTSSEQMQPDSLRGFAPLISGVARTNARITVQQYGNIIYQTYVAPGPFRITDLYQTGQGGDLTVTIREADGEVRTQKIAWSTLAVMRRAGSYQYEVTAGRFDPGGGVNANNADFLLASWIIGLPHNLTLYSGAILADHYNSLVGGAGFSLGDFGAISADITTASARLHDVKERKSGESYRLRYSKSMISTGTSIDLSAYRYSTTNYYNFTDFNYYQHNISTDLPPWYYGRQRSLFQTSISQQLGEVGTLFLSFSRYNYWGDERVDNNVSAGYSTSIGGVSLGVNYSIDHVYNKGNWPENRQISFNMQVPLSVFAPQTNTLNNLYASYQLSSAYHSQIQQQAGLNGNAFDNKLSYNLTHSWAKYGGSDNSNLNLSYQGSQGQVSMGYSYSGSSSVFNAGLNGGIVIHLHGVTLSQTLGDAMALVHTPDATGVSVMARGINTDRNGYAIIPYLSAYHNNNISLDPTTLPDNVDIKQSSVNVYPTRGAVVMANFKTRIGYQALITLMHQGSPLLFGSTVTPESSDGEPDAGIVGDGGQVWLTGLPPTGRLLARWGEGADQQCYASYDLTHVKALSDYNSVRYITVECQ